MTTLHRRVASVAILVPALVASIYTIALAHAVVYPRASATSAHERYVIRVPNERNVPTTRVEITFPADVKVGSFIDVPGWTLEVVRDSAKRITGAVWTGSLPPERFAEFPFVATNPKDPTEIHWPIIQTYADGEKAEWTGAKDSKKPASSTNITAVVDAAKMTGGTSPMIAYAALGLSVVSLGLALRPRAK